MPVTKISKHQIDLSYTTDTGLTGRNIYVSQNIPITIEEAINIAMNTSQTEKTGYFLPNKITNIDITQNITQIIGSTAYKNNVYGNFGYVVINDYVVKISLDVGTISFINLNYPGSTPAIINGFLYVNGYEKINLITEIKTNINFGNILFYYAYNDFLYAIRNNNNVYEILRIDPLTDTITHTSTLGYGLDVVIKAITVCKERLCILLDTREGSNPILVNQFVSFRRLDNLNTLQDYLVQSIFLNSINPLVYATTTPSYFRTIDFVGTDKNLWILGTNDKFQNEIIYEILEIDPIVLKKVFKISISQAGVPKFSENYSRIKFHKNVLWITTPEEILTINPNTRVFLSGIKVSSFTETTLTAEAYTNIELCGVSDKLVLAAPSTFKLLDFTGVSAGPNFVPGTTTLTHDHIEEVFINEGYNWDNGVVYELLYEPRNEYVDVYKNMDKLIKGEDKDYFVQGNHVFLNFIPNNTDIIRINYIISQPVLMSHLVGGYTTIHEHIIKYYNGNNISSVQLDYSENEYIEAYVYLNGQLKTKNVDYTINGNILQLLVNPLTIDDELKVEFLVPKTLNAVVSVADIPINSIGTEELKNNSVTTPKIVNNSITFEKLTPNSVDNINIRVNAITESKIADNSISENKLQNNSISTTKIKNYNITNEKLALNSINTHNIINGSIIESKLSDDCISTAKIIDSAVTSAKIADNAILINHIKKIGTGAVTGEHLYLNTEFNETINQVISGILYPNFTQINRDSYNRIISLFSNDIVIQITYYGNTLRVNNIKLYKNSLLLYTYTFNYNNRGKLIEIVRS